MAPDEMIFAEAVRIGSPAERSVYLDRACAGDAALRRQVESLLLANDQAGGFLASPLVAASAETVGLPVFADSPPRGTLRSAAAPGDGVGKFVGPYKLLERLGEGGMGEVYMAEQLRPVRRRVALKIVKPGMDSGQVIARFEAERQALAMMDHPGIARVLDAGTTEAGRPYFAMELVRGVAITDYCDANHLTPRERLGLFVQVCNAVQHAHQKGVIHRDLKPSNVLVTMHDGVPVPKVIDFGIAKATQGHSLTERTLFTHFAQLIGTPLYMSPEQAELSGLDVDTRSDIYSLGVLLYELLTGTTPFDRQRLGRAALDELRRIIREEEPPRPSTRLSTLRETLAGVSEKRRTDPKRLGQIMRGELDWIVMRCLEKDRTRRYETASGLGRDVQRYLADEPVEACPPRARYRMGKFLRRYRGPVFAAALLLLALSGGVVGTSWGLVRAEQRRAEAEAARREEAGHRREAQLARQKEAAQRQRAEEHAHEARLRLAQFERANELLSSIFKALDPSPEQKREASIRLVLAARLDTVAAQLQEETGGEGVAMAKLQNVLGCAQRHLGYPHKAIPLLSRAHRTFAEKLGPRAALTTEAANNLAVSHLHAGQPLEALPLLEEAVRLQTDGTGPAHPDLLIHMGNLGDAYAAAGRLDEAVPLLEQTLKKQAATLGETDVHTLTVRMNLARAYLAAGRTDEALQLGTVALQQLTEKFGSKHRLPYVGMIRLAEAYRSTGQIDDALPLYEQALEGLRRVLGPDSLDTYVAMECLGWAYHEAKRSEAAVPLLEQALEGQERECGTAYRETLWTMAKLGLVYQYLGQHDRSVPLLKRALECGEAVRPSDHPETLVAMDHLAGAYRDAGQHAEAAGVLARALRARERLLGEGHPEAMGCRASLIESYQAAGSVEAAVPLIKQHAELHEAAGDLAEAEKWRKALPPTSTQEPAAVGHGLGPASGLRLSI